MTLKVDRQCTYNITSWHVHITIVAMEMQQCVLLNHITFNNIKLLSVFMKVQYCVPFVFMSRN